MAFKVKRLVLLLLIPHCLIIYSQEINQKQYNNKTKEEILVGKCTRAALMAGKYKNWFKSEYGGYGYLLDRKVIDSLKNNLNEIKIVIILATWCSDSKKQVPRFFRIIDYLEFDEDNISLICVDRNKSASTVSLDNYNVILVPTFIFFKEGKEIGRIIETPKLSLEKDMVQILFSTTDEN